MKSSSGAGRSHHFGLEQVRPPEGIAVVVASVQVAPAGAGLSIEQLLAIVHDRLHSQHELLLRVDQTVATAMGDGYADALGRNYDPAIAKQTFALFRAADIPAVEAPPHGVSGVHFVSDLSDVSPVSEEWCASEGGLFAAAVAK